MVWKRLSHVLLLAWLILAVPRDTQAGQVAAYSHLNTGGNEGHGGE